MQCQLVFEVSQKLIIVKNSFRKPLTRISRILDFFGRCEVYLSFWNSSECLDSAIDLVKNFVEVLTDLQFVTY